MSLQDPVLKLLTDRFDRVDADNKEIVDKVGHIEETVNQHAVYWSISKWAAATIIAPLLAYIGWTKGH